jgi:hypothetical protein
LEEKTVRKRKEYMAKIITKNKQLYHTYNHSFLGSRDQEGLSWRPARAKYLRDSISKTLNTKQDCLTSVR